MEIILFQPEIPQNTGNIARTCAVTHTRLTLVRPLGFTLSTRQLKRAGLDYWEGVKVNIIDSLEEYLATKNQPFYFLSTKGKKIYTEVPYTKDTLLIFGSESAGVPLSFHEKWGEQFYTIPMAPGNRSLNLSNAVSIVLYEGLRQQNFVFGKN